MARAKDKLSTKFTEKSDLKPGLHGDGGGLYLQISDQKTKAWVFRYMIAGRARKMGLGDFDLVSLKEARRKRDAAYSMVVDGIDPIDERDARKAALTAEKAKAMTFGQVAREYINAHKSSWKNSKHAAQWEMTLMGTTPKGPAEHDYCKLIRNLPVHLIDAALVLKVLRPVWEQKTETASRLRGRIETVLDYAKVALKLRDGDNPARWGGNLEYSLPEKSKVADSGNYPALPFDLMPDFTRELRQRAGLAATALEFAILTASRTSEIIGARWSEVDESKQLWTVPKGRMKGERGARRHDHVVPLSKRALALLADLPREGDLIFPLSNAAMAAVIDRMNDPQVKWVDPKQENRAVVPHGFRSSFRDWAAETTDFDHNLAEMALSHTLASKVEAAYRRGSMVEKRRVLMEAWAQHCEGRATGNVVRLVR